MSRYRIAAAIAAWALGASTAWGWPGCEQDLVSAVAHGDSLSVFHDHAAYNCCMDSVVYSVSQDASEIVIQETERITTPCMCLCCYDFSVGVGGLASGEYLLRFRWLDSDTGRWEEWTSTVFIPGAGSAPFVAFVTDSGCIDPNSAPGTIGESPWGRVKDRYR